MTDDWVRWGYDLGSSGFNSTGSGWGNISADLVVGGPHDGEPKIALLDTLWSSPVLDGKIETQALVVGAFVYVVTRAGTFYKLNIADGTIAGTYAIGAPCSSTPHIVGGVAYFGDDAGRFHAVNVTTMADVWAPVTPGSGAAMLSHCVVSGTRAFIGDLESSLFAILIASGATSWDLDLSGIAGGIDQPGILGPLAVWSSHVYCATGVGVAELPLTGGISPSATFPARNQAYGVAIQTHPNGTDFLAFESEDHWAYLYDRASGERLWMENHQGGDAKCPVGLCLSPTGLYDVGFVLIGTHNWSIQPHAARGGDLIWKRDASPSPAPSAAIVSGFAIANDVFFGVWPPNDGRAVGFPLDQTRGGHTADFKFGTSTGVDGSGNSANKDLATPTLAGGVLYVPAGDKIVHAFA